MGSKVSTYGDMYSFGILMLEMITGRRPTDERFEDGQSLRTFVENSLDDNLLQILDPHLVPRDEEVAIEDGNSENLIPAIENCLVSLLRIGLACSVESPKERMNIVDVTRELNIIRAIFLDGKRNQDFTCFRLFQLFLINCLYSYNCLFFYLPINFKTPKLPIMSYFFNFRFRCSCSRVIKPDKILVSYGI